MLFPGSWLDTGSTNRWRMFDVSVTSQTEAINGDIQVTLKSPARVSAVCLFNIDASSVRITMTDAVDGLVYDKTTSLVSNSGITDWYAYFLAPIVRFPDFIASDLPAYSGATVAVTLAGGGGTAKCGACIVGSQRIIGGAQYGLSTGIQDYSVKSKDAFGNYSILERAYNKKVTMTVRVENSLIDELQVVLAAFRATPLVFIGADDYLSTAVYGFYKDFSTTIAYKKTSICSLSLEGLT